MAVSGEHDVIIVGAGPSGSSTAIRLVRAGLSVLLLEQKKFPRQKLCGEFISPECLPYFAELGVLDKMKIEGSAIERTVFYARNGKSVAVPSEWFGAEHALGLSRATMDDVLLDRARAIGVDIVEDAHVTGVISTGERVQGVTIRDRADVLAQLTIDATGRSRILAREIEKLRNNRRKARADYVAFKAHARGASIRPADCEIYGFPGGYGGCVRIERDLYNLCFIVSSEIARRYRSNADAIVVDVVCKNLRACDALQEIYIDGDWLAVPIESYGPAELAPAEGLLAVGDAAGFIDPFTGSGILLAVQSAQVISDAIAVEFAKPQAERSFQELADRYHRRYHAAFDRRLRASSLVRRAAFTPFLGETIVRILALSRGLTQTLARATRQTKGQKQASSFPQVP